MNAEEIAQRIIVATVDSKVVFLEALIAINLAEPDNHDFESIYRRCAEVVHVYETRGEEWGV